MKIVFGLLLISIALNAQNNDNANEQIYGLLLDRHLYKAKEALEHNADYGAILKALGDLGEKRIITAKEKREIEKILRIQRTKDTLVFNTDYVPKIGVLRDLRRTGVITAKEKRKIKKALITGYLVPSPELKKYFENVRKNSPVAKDENYTERFFSKPIDLNMAEKVIFSKTTLKNKKYNERKAIGCASIIFFSKKDEHWLIKDVVCYEMY